MEGGGGLVVLLLLSAGCYVAVIFFPLFHGAMDWYVMFLVIHVLTFFSADDIFRDIKFFVSDEKVK